MNLGAAAWVTRRANIESEKRFVAVLCNRGHIKAVGTPCRDCDRITRRCYYFNNREKMIAKTRAYETENRERVLARKNESQKRWQKENREASNRRSKHQKSRRRAAKFGGGGRHTQAEWDAVIARQDGKCNGCSQVKKLERDHIKPLKHGGSDSIDNIQGLCRNCNAQKSAKVGAT